VGPAGPSIFKLPSFSYPVKTNYRQCNAASITLADYEQALPFFDRVDGVFSRRRIRPEPHASLQSRGLFQPGGQAETFQKEECLSSRKRCHIFIAGRGVSRARKAKAFQKEGSLFDHNSISLSSQEVMVLTDASDFAHRDCGSRRQRFIQASNENC
jgi:hypothetical protein